MVWSRRVSPSTPAHRRRVLAFLFGVTTAIWVWQWPTLSQPLIEAHGFRQTQTAYQTVSLVEGWGSLLHPRLPVYGTPWEVPFEFPFFQWTASWLIRVLDLSADRGSRMAGLIWFTLCIVPLWKLVRTRLDALTSGLVIVFFSFSPFAVQWSRTSMIDFCSVFFGLCFVYAFHRMWTSGSVPWAVSAALTGAMCGLVKATTLVAMLPFAFVLATGVIESLRRPLRHGRRLLLAGGCLAVSAAVTAAWTRHADAIKNARPQTAWLTSSALNTWNFGTFDQRRIWNNWEAILSRIDGTLTPKHAALLLVLVPLVSPGSRRLAWGALASVLTAIAVFFNLYVVHDYYLMAVAPQVAVLLALAVAALVSSIHSRRRALLTCCIAGVVLLASWIPSGPYWRMSRTDLKPRIDEISALASPDQYVLVFSDTWDPVTLYYARRKGLVINPFRTPARTLEKLPDLERYDFYQGPPTELAFVGLRGWFTPAGANTIRIDDRLDDLRSYPVAISSDPSVTEFTNRNTRGRKRTVTIVRCDGVQSIDLSRAPMGTKIRTISRGANVLNIGTGRAAVPVGTYLVTNPGRPGSGDHVMRCRGDGSVEVRWWT